jgi:hypothetical protein
VKKIFFIAVFIFGISQVNAQVQVQSIFLVQPINAQATKTPQSTGSTTAKTFSKRYPLPKMFTFIKTKDANFEIFPKEINPAKYFNASSTASSTILAISRKWQTACLYNASGTVAAVNGYKMCFQAGTGKPIKKMFQNNLTDLSTPLGLFQIQSKKDKDYKSRTYTTTGEEVDKIIKDKKLQSYKDVEDTAPMPYAMHIGLVFSLQENENKNKVKGFAFTDGTAIHEKQTHTTTGAWAYPSHGCVAIPKNYGRYLQSVMQIGDLVMIFEEDFPISLQESVDTGLMSRIK